MPHIIVKLWPGKSQQQKARLAQQIGQAKNLATACKAAVHEQQKSSSSPEPVAVLERPPLDISGHLERPLFWGARRIEKLHAIVTELTNNGAKATALTTEVTDPVQVQKLIDLAVEQFGRIDVILNNAGLLDCTVKLYLKRRDFCAATDRSPQRCVFRPGRRPLAL